jgi:Uma2 family endonuclease
MIAEPTKRAATMTLEEFLARPDTNQPMEYEDGQVILLPMPTSKHQRINRQITLVLNSAKPSGEILYAPMDVVLDGRSYQPDIFWIREGGTCVDKGTYFEGPPDLVVEILSPSTGRRDRRDKFVAYEQHGVSEYWMVDQESALVEIYTLVDGKFQRHGAFGAEDTFTSPALGADKPIDGKAIFAE